MALQAFLERPYFGWGLPPIDNVLSSGFLLPDGIPNVGHFHNDLLESIVMGGAVGLCSFLATIIVLFRQAFKDLSMLALLATMVTIGLFERYWFDQQTLFLFCCLWVMFYKSKKVKLRIDGNKEEYTLDGSYFANKYPNDGMIDMMGYLGNGMDFDFLFYIGRLAKTSDYCMEKIPGYGSGDENIYPMGFYKEPNKLIETVTGKSADYSDDPSPVEYKFDEDKNLTEVKISIPYKINSYSYEVWTTDEYEERPEWDEELQQEVMVKYYFTTTKNHKSEYVKSGNDYYTYTISY